MNKAIESGYTTKYITDKWNEFVNTNVSEAAVNNPGFGSEMEQFGGLAFVRSFVGGVNAAPDK